VVRVGYLGLTLKMYTTKGNIRHISMINAHLTPMASEMSAEYTYPIAVPTGIAV
jgi:hypothetical protein